MKVFGILLMTVFLIHLSDCRFLKKSNKGIEVSPRIIGGQLASLAEIKYQASLQVEVAPDLFMAYCGGTIITDRAVLTAAQCVYFEDEEGDIILIPANFLRVVSDTVNITSTVGQFRAVTKVTPNDRFNPTRNLEHDIAILTLASPFNLGSTLNPVALRTGPTPSGESCVVSGYGSESFGGLSSTVLLRVNVPTTPHANCRTTYNNTVTDQMICAGDSGHDSCEGDVGGPLVCSGVLAGIVSFGFECARPNYPTVHTEVSKYLDWISQNS